MVKWFKLFTWKKAGKALRGVWEGVLKPIGKPLLVRFVEAKGAELGDKLEMLVDTKSPKVFTKAFDGGQKKAIGIIRKMSFVPGWLSRKGIAIIQDEGDKAQDKLLVQVKKGDEKAFRKAYDVLLGVVVARIKAL